MSNPYWNPKLVSENGVLRPTMGTVLAIEVDPGPPRIQVRINRFDGDGSVLAEAWMPIVSTVLDDIDVDAQVMVIFMGDTPESGVVMGKVDWF